MQNRVGILILTGVVALLCIYYLSFTFVSNSIKSDATTYATNTKGDVDITKKQHYIDSLWKEPVYLGNTLEEVTTRELGLGLDLQGGMHVVLEVSPSEILRGLAGGTRDPKFEQALKKATEAQKSGQSKFVDNFISAYKEVAPNTKLATIFANSTNRGKINFQSSTGNIIFH